MKTSLLPAIRVSEEFRASLEGVLRDGETLSTFLLDSAARALEQRQIEDSFIAGGLAGLEESRRTGETYTTTEVFDEVRRRFAERRKQIAEASGR